MDDDRREGAQGPVTPWLYALAAAYALAHTAVVSRYGIFRDELYYVACARHLAWGYVDHPPAIALLTRIELALFGQSVAALRVLPILAGAATVVLAGLVARELGGGRFAQVAAGLAVAISPVYLFLFHILSMNAVEVLLWTVAAYVLVRLLGGADPRLWLLFGAVAGVGLETKHSMLLLGFGVFLGVLLSPARRLLASPWPWLGGLLAALLFAPNLLWEVRHGWPTLEFARNAEAGKNVHYSPLAFFGQQALQMQPWTLPLWLAGLLGLLFAPSLRRFRALGWAYLAIAAVLLVQASKPYYLAPAYPWLLAAGAVLLDRWTAERGRARPWLRGAALVLLAVNGAITAPLTLPLLPEEAFIRYAARLGIKAEAGERHEMGVLPQHFADMHGWPELAAETARVWSALPPAERARCGIFGQNYGEAGAIDYFGPALGLPHAISAHNSYYLWGPDGYDGSCLVVLGDDRSRLGQLFGDVQEAGRFDCRYCMPYEDGLAIHVCRRPKRTLAAIWPEIKSFG
jgi:dolichyl-phosphate-mannose-protein mannosyltransferase